MHYQYLLQHLQELKFQRVIKILYLFLISFHETKLGCPFSIDWSLSSIFLNVLLHFNEFLLFCLCFIDKLLNQIIFSFKDKVFQNSTDFLEIIHDVFYTKLNLILLKMANNLFIIKNVVYTFICFKFKWNMFNLKNNQ